MSVLSGTHPLRGFSEQLKYETYTISCRFDEEGCETGISTLNTCLRAYTA